MKLKGICACQGEIRARAFVVKNIESIPMPPEGDYILVAPYTTPVLNLLILNSKGVICERGGMTCHTAVIAREFSIPCAVSVNSATELISQGQEIYLKDGEVINE